LAVERADEAEAISTASAHITAATPQMIANRTLAIRANTA
jgi:hypothetical protein